MNEDSNEPTDPPIKENLKKKTREEKVALTSDSTAKLDAWIKVAQDRKKGTKITRKDLVNWLINHTSDFPSKNDLNELINLFFNEERFLRLLLKEAKIKKRSSANEANIDQNEETI